MYMRRKRFKEWVNRQAEKKLHHVSFFRLPLKFRIGLAILTLSFAVSYGIPPFLAWLSYLKQNTYLLTVGGPAAYVAGWFLGMAGIALAGASSIQYPVYFFAVACKKLLPGYFKNL